MDLSMVYIVLIIIFSREYSFATIPSKTRAQSPKLLPMVISSSYKEGSDVEIYCTLESKTDATDTEFQWLKDGNIIDSTRDQVHDLTQKKSRIDTNQNRGHSFLSISNITDNDAGTYTCMAENRLGSDKVTANLVVSVELSWLIEPQDTHLGIGQELSIDCVARGQPKPTIKWTKLGDLSATTSDATFIGDKLKIKHTKLDHSGWYECKAFNSLNKEIKKIIKVDIQGKF